MGCRWDFSGRVSTSGVQLVARSDGACDWSARMVKFTVAETMRRKPSAVAHARRGLIFQVAARMPAVNRPLMIAAIGIASASAAVPAHPIEEKASAKVASRDEVWRRRNWLRR